MAQQIRSERSRPAPFWRDSCHGLDYTLFWLNPRRDAMRRTAAALAESSRCTEPARRPRHDEPGGVRSGCPR